MSRQHAGHFSKKHPADTTVDHAIMEAVSSKLVHQKITCKAAFKIAAGLSVPPSKVGIAIDLQEGRIISCQLGLFGYGDAEKKLRGTAQINDAIKTAINASLAEQKLSCKKAWEIAQDLKRPRLEISQTCESLGIKICHCQLGAF
jgi:hypothetical protein